MKKKPDLEKSLNKELITALKDVHDRTLETAPESFVHRPEHCDFCNLITHAEKML